MEILELIFITIIAFFITPFISFAMGFLVGLIIKITIGANIVAGLGLVGLNIPLDSLPLFFATLTVIASFFNTTPSSINKSKLN